MISHPSLPAVNPLQKRMIEDMTVRGFGEKTRHDYVRKVRAFAAFIGRSPDTAAIGAQQAFSRGTPRVSNAPEAVIQPTVARRLKTTPSGHSRQPRKRQSRMDPWSFGCAYAHDMCPGWRTSVTGSLPDPMSSTRPNIHLHREYSIIEDRFARWRSARRQGLSPAAPDRSGCAPECAVPDAPK